MNLPLLRFAKCQAVGSLRLSSEQLSSQESDKQRVSHGLVCCLEQQSCCSAGVVRILVFLSAKLS